MIKGRLSEEGREPRNVRVVLQGPKERGIHGGAAHLFLVDETGIFLNMEIRRREAHVGKADGSASAHAHSNDDAHSSDNEQEDNPELLLQQKTEELDSVNRQLSEEVAEIECLSGEVKRKKKYKQLWRLNCESLVEHDAELAAKDELLH